MINFKTNSIILSAGRGKRMRYKTTYIAKPLIKIQNKTLLEINLKKLYYFGIKSCVINTSHNHKTINNFIKTFSYRNAYPKIINSHEQNRLETGGGIKNAIHFFNSDNILAANGDSILINKNNDCPIKNLFSSFCPEKMDILLLLVSLKRSVSYSGKGDFIKSNKLKLSPIKRKNIKNGKGLVFTGWQLIKKDLFKNISLKKFSLNFLFDKAEKSNKLYGIIHSGHFLHLSTPKSILEAEDFLKKNNKVL